MARSRRTAHIEFIRGETRRYASVLHRPDGVDVRFDGGAYNHVGGRAGDVPHDLAHLIVEEELRLREGVWGVLVAGGLFRHATVVAGRQAPHAARRGREIVARASDSIMQAEVLTRAVCDLSAADAQDPARAVREASGERWWTATAGDEAIERACARLRSAAARWAELAPDERIELEWRLS